MGDSMSKKKHQFIPSNYREVDNEELFNHLLMKLKMAYRNGQLTYTYTRTLIEEIDDDTLLPKEIIRGSSTMTFQIADGDV